MNKTVYITDLNGKLIEVTNYELALRQAKQMVKLHKERVKQSKTNNDLIVYPHAQKEWNHILKELLKLNADDTKVKQKKKKSSNKYFNTLVMMGVSRKDAYMFVDAMKNYGITINQEVKRQKNKVMLDTVINGISLKERFEKINKGELKIDNLYENIQLSNILSMLDVVLQEYYQKELFSNVF